MKLTWPELAKRYVVYSEPTPLKRVSMTRIRLMIKQDLDYMCILRGKHGEIYRFDAEGKIWGVYLRPTSEFHWRRATQAKLNALKELTPVSVGSCEGAWKFDAPMLDKVADIIKAKKRRPKKEKK